MRQILQSATEFITNYDMYYKVLEGEITKCDRLQSMTAITKWDVAALRPSLNSRIIRRITTKVSRSTNQGKRKKVLIFFDDVIDDVNSNFAQ